MESVSPFFSPFIKEPHKCDRRGIGFDGLPRWFQPSSPSCSMLLSICRAVVAHNGLLGRLGATLVGSSCCWRAWLLLQVAACLVSALSPDSVLPSGQNNRILSAFPIFSPETASFKTPQLLAEAVSNWEIENSSLATHGTWLYCRQRLVYSGNADFTGLSLHGCFMCPAKCLTVSSSSHSIV